jgi:hypothetical protein
VWDAFNPHPELRSLALENVFVSAGNGNRDGLNRRETITAGLQEVLLPYPGYLLPAGDAALFRFEPLLQTGQTSGASSFFDLVQPTGDGMVLNASLSRARDERRYVLAARVRSSRPVSDAAGAAPINVVAVADIDFISDYFFQVRAAAPPNACASGLHRGIT